MRSSEAQGVAAVFWDVPCGARASRGWAQPSSWRGRQCSARGGPGTLLVGTLCWGGGTAQGHPESEREGTSRHTEVRLVPGRFQHLPATRPPCPRRSGDPRLPVEGRAGCWI